MGLTCDEIAAAAGDQNQPTKAVDMHSYCRGLLAAAHLCEKPVRLWEADGVSPASPAHAQLIREFVRAHYLPSGLTHGECK